MRMTTSTLAICLLTLCTYGFCGARSAVADDPWVVYEGKDGPGKGKHIVLISGDEEYRSEEALPMLGKILAVHHGFKCTVLFAIDPATGEIEPTNLNNIPGLEALRDADMMIIATRFRELPDEQMKYIVEFLNSGKPIMGLRTATHAFNYKTNKDSPYAKYSFRSKDPVGGFGQAVLGDTWINHHGHHGYESTLGVINEEYADHGILKGVEKIWGPTDVYSVANLPGNAKVLVYGQVLKGMDPTDEAVEGEKNDPMMPIVWTRNYTGESGKTSRVICTTMGASVDLQCAGLRRVLVNSCYWGLGLEDQIPETSNVDYVSPYKPTYFGYAKHTRGVKPADLSL
ncbi:MAG: hypothetical protein ACC628_22460 [Pirellulaceae bacterium]